ncbi:hypothetical protein B5U98_08060 [Bosea sp. Tri-39]|nr:hypothetical protein BLM15_28835 [Bosea sp. Tri-49]RXT24915.1 hypothetical protein B5U98_08060 [Bosea sp. Tri-39]RXT33466.1 hypothetical protein B5U99_18485 [Bosea sp. Tri-54]
MNRLVVGGFLRRPSFSPAAAFEVERSAIDLITGLILNSYLEVGSLAVRKSFLRHVNERPLSVISRGLLGGEVHRLAG